MSNPSKQKGTDGENAVVRYLRQQGWIHAERRALNGAADRGDVAGIPGVVIEVKNAKTLAWGEWLEEAAVERSNAGADIGVVWAKRSRKGSPADWYVMMTGAHFVEILKALGY